MHFTSQHNAELDHHPSFPPARCPDLGPHLNASYAIPRRARGCALAREGAQLLLMRAFQLDHMHELRQS